MGAPPKRRVAPGGRRPPPIALDDAALGSRLDDPAAGHGPMALPRWSPTEQAGQVGEAVRAWRRGGEQPAWMRAVVWSIVIALIGPMALAAWYAVTT